MDIRAFMQAHFRHFNSAELVAAADAYAAHVADGGAMLVAMAGAMSTAEIGRTLAEMIRQGKVQAISCTGANLEEDIYNLVAHDDYKKVRHYRDLTPGEEADLYANGLNRVTDTCIPEETAMRRVESVFLSELQKMAESNQPCLPHELIYRMVQQGRLSDCYQIDPCDSWVVAAAEKDLPLFVPGWEDSTLGNCYAAKVYDGVLPDQPRVRSGIDYMLELIRWYEQLAQKRPIGFFQIGGGIAGDFPICVVPLMQKDLGLVDTPVWGYFCQISDSTTSYGSYSGAVPNEKISWGKLGADTPRFFIESDATIVVPLLFGYVLGW